MQKVNDILSSIKDPSFDLKASCNALSVPELVFLAESLNAVYRQGEPLISDADYDHIVIAELERRDPENPFLNTVEDEGETAVAEGKVVTLPARMLSTNKAYTEAAINAWINRIIKAASEINLPANDIMIRVTPKLDGFASYDDGEKMYTRGNGIRGTDISYVTDHGLQLYRNAERGLGAGEIVVDPQYFEDNLAGAFSNTRNVISGVLRKKPEPLIKKTIDEGGVIFAPFAALDATECDIYTLQSKFEAIIEKSKGSVAFDIDGVIIEVTNDALKEHMGATQKAHRWMIALKENEAPVSIPVISVTAQTSRKGRVVPVLELEPTQVTGVTVSRCTGHNYTNIKTSGIGAGAIIQLVRSGLVIPKVVGVEKSVVAEIPTHCPSCNEPLEWGNKEDGTEMDLICNNSEACPAQAQKRLLHWFTTLENVDGFGPSTIEVLTDAGISSVPEIYSMSVSDFTRLGFGEKTSENLVEELERSRNEAVEDYRFLAAFGIRSLGKSISETVLSHHSLDNIFSLTEDDLKSIKKIGDKKAKFITTGVSHIGEAFSQLRAMNFNLITTPLASEKELITSPIAGKAIVFTGTMLQDSRSNMTKAAKALGAKVSSGVTSKTDYLVAGEKVGTAKTNDAKKHGTIVLSEQEYYDLLAS